jgi:hypothetical protein
MTSAGDYVAMCKALLDNVRWFDASPVSSPAGSPFDADQLAAVVRAQQAQLPAPYRAAYAAPLLAALPDLVAQLRQQVDRSLLLGAASGDALGEARSVADTLVGAVRDRGEPAYLAPLGRFQAVVSNLYRSFLAREQRVGLPQPLAEVLPPLVTFAPTSDRGPFTLPVDRVRQYIGASVGVVSLPGAYAAHPLVWAGLAHETGGHDVIHADPGLIEQLAAGVGKLDALPPALRPVWATWIDEAASDVYGILNIGPAFAVGLIALFATIGAARAASTAPLGAVRTQLAVAGSQMVDAHPVELLRLHVALGAVDALAGLSPPRRATWLDLLGGIAEAAAGGAATIDARDITTGAVVQHLPLPVMASAARAVGAYIATARLDALGGHSIQDIETWDDADDEAAAGIAAAAATGPIVALGDDAQLLAGATLALLRAPSAYAAITAQLAAALDDSFARDPIFGTAAPESALALSSRGRTLARTPASPQFPLALE